MQKKWKQTGAALLIAGLTVTGTSYAWADEKATETINLSQLGKDSTTDVVEESTETVDVPKGESVIKEDEATEATDVIEETNETVEVPKGESVVKEDEATVVEESVLPEVPEGYTAGNLVALGKAYEKVQNPTAKASIKRNMERSIEKRENKQSVTETSEQPKIEIPEQPEVKEEPVKPAQVKQEKAPQAELNSQHKEQRQVLNANQKVEREALKAESKADKVQQKQLEKEKKN